MTRLWLGEGLGSVSKCTYDTMRSGSLEEPLTSGWQSLTPTFCQVLRCCRLEENQFIINCRPVLCPVHSNRQNNSHCAPEPIWSKDQA